MLNEIDYVLVLKHTESVNFSLDKSSELLIPVKDFHCKFVTSFVLGHFDFAACSGAESLADSKVVEHAA